MRYRSSMLKFLSLLVWPIVLALLVWVLRTAPLQEALAAVLRLRLWQIAVLLIGNALLVILFAGRWWLILRAQGWRAPYLRAAMYRMAAASVSYFTPGSQFGGEPVQVILAHRRHGVPLPSAAASVAAERLIELSVNLSVLAMGIAITLQGPAFRESSRPGALALPLVLLSIPIGLLLAVRLGRRPASWLLSILPARIRGSQRISSALGGIIAAEGEVALLLRDHSAAIVLALTLSLVSWLGMIGEIWLTVAFVGLPLSLTELIAVVTAARLGILMPSPGGLGTLEASQVWMFSALGYDPALGLSVALIIRLRDILFALTGLAIGSAHLGRSLLNRPPALPDSESPSM